MMHPLPADHERILWQGYHDGDQGAYGALWVHYENDFHRQALVQTGGNQELADEALGKLGLHLAQREVQRHYNPTRPWKPWASVVFRHLILDVLRALAREKNRRQVVSGQPIDILDPNREVVPESQAMLDELKKHLDECLGHLPEEWREVLILRHRHGLTLKAIAKLLFGSDTSGVISKVFRRLEQAQASLKQCLSQKGYGEADQ